MQKVASNGGVEADTPIVIIGTGPYGLSLAAHLRSLGVPFRIFGHAMENWRSHMPAGMMLKSRPWASSLDDPAGAGTLEKYCRDHRVQYHDTDIPVSLEVFQTYGMDFQRRFVPNVEARKVSSLERIGNRFVLELDDGQKLSAAHVVIAVGTTYFGQIPDAIRDLPEDLVTHSSAHSDLSRFSGREVTVVGAGASAVDIATLLSEAGAKVSLISREAPKFYPVESGSPSPWRRISHPRGALSHTWSFWAYERWPGLFRYLPGKVRLDLIRRVLAPASPSTIQERFTAGVTVSVGETIEKSSEDNGRVRLLLRLADGSVRETITDHVIAATGYRPALSSIAFLDDGLRADIKARAGIPELSARFESSVPGLYFVGLSAGYSFGPLMRFVAGNRFVAPRLAKELAARVPERMRIISDATSAERVPT